MKHIRTSHALAAFGLCLATPALATNGDNLIGIGPISRALGGTGIAAPQDAISAVFSNPAAMCISPSCAAPQADFALTAFMPEVNAWVDIGDESYKAASKDKVYPIPAMGVSLPIGGEASRWRAGMAIYGVSGLGVDYGGTDIDTSYPGMDPDDPMTPGMVATTYTDLQILKIAPSVAYSISPDFSIGASFHIDYATLDLDQGKESDWAAGIQLGMTWKPRQDVTLGLTYTSPQKTTFDEVFNFGAGPEDLTLEAPQQVGLGVAWTGMDHKLLVEVDGKWINWSDAEGYDTFDWDDQWTLGIGVQYEVIPQKLFLRAGYNYGSNPVNKHSISSADPMDPNTSNYWMETMRVIGFPAIVEHHLGLGVGYRLNECLVLNAAWVHAFEKGFSESGTGPLGEDVNIKSTLSENSIDLGLTWMF